MAVHIRQQIREAVADAVTGLNTTGVRVFKNRLYPLQVTDLPCLIVTCDGDRREYLTAHSPAQVEVEVLVKIDGYVKDTATLDDTIDAISEEVEVAMEAANITDSFECAGTQIDESVIGAQPICKVSIAYRIKAYILSNAPDVIL